MAPGERPIEHVVHRRRQIWGRRRGRRSIAIDDLVHDGDDRLRPKRLPPGQHFVGHDRQRKLVCRSVHGQALNLLRRHVAWRSGQHRRARHLVETNDFRDAKVCYLQRRVAVQHQVGRLDVAVDDSSLVGVIQSPGRLPENVQRFGRREPHRRAHPLLQRRAVDVLHGDVRQVFLCVRFVDSNDVRVR